MSEYFEPGEPTVELANAIARIRVSTWDLDELVNYVLASIVDSYFEDNDEFWSDYENYKDQLEA